MFEQLEIKIKDTLGCTADLLTDLIQLSPDAWKQKKDYFFTMYEINVGGFYVGVCELNKHVSRTQNEKYQLFICPKATSGIDRDKP